MLQDLLAPFLVSKCTHILQVHVYQFSKTKNGSTGVFEKEKGALLFVSLYIHKYMYTEFKEYVAYYLNNIKVLSGLKFYAHLN